MKTMTLSVEYPDSLLALADMDRKKFENDAKLAMAMKMYELGRLSSGQAAELAQIPRVDFLLQCRQYGANTVDWDIDEMEREFNHNEQ